MTYGYAGKILWVDLSNGKMTEDSIENYPIRHFLGGYGLGANIIYKRQNAKADPLGEEPDP